MTRLIGGAVVVVAAIALAVGLTQCGGSSKHKATCWTKEYAAHPAAAWAKHPSATHRHGEGPRGANVCDPK